MRNLGRMLEDCCRRYASNPFVCSSGSGSLRHVTYGDFLTEVVACAARLAQRGVGAGDRVGIITPKSTHQVRAFYACWRLGAIAVPVCEVLGDPEMSFVIRDSEPSLILVEQDLQRKAVRNCGGTPVLTFEELADAPADGGEPPPISEMPAEATAALVYTSGSTGMPKGVMLTHRNFLVNASSALEALRFGTEDRLISVLPYWHSYALVAEVICTVMAGAQTAIPRDMKDFRRNLATYRPTVVLVVPRIADAIRTGIERRVATASPGVRRLYERALHNASRIFTADPRPAGGLLRLATHRWLYDPLVFRRIRESFGGRLRFFISGGAPLDLEHQIFFKYLGVPLYQGYGLTETSPIVSSNLPERHRLGSSGPVLPWLQPENGGDYTFRDAHGNLGRTVRGELLVKGACVMKGYWRHTDASAKVIDRGWLHTGDMGYVDEDGFLFLEGRRGNLIVLRGGEKLHPEPVEDAIRNCPLVQEAVVIGDACKNVYALLNVDSEQAAEIPADGLDTQLRNQVFAATRHLAPYQRPKDILVLPGFSIEDGTLTATLKVRRHQIRERYSRQIREFLAANGESGGASVVDPAGGGPKQGVLPDAN